MKKQILLVLCSLLAICMAFSGACSTATDKGKDPAKTEAAGSVTDAPAQTSSGSSGTDSVDVTDPTPDPAAYDRNELRAQFLSEADKVTVGEDSVTFTDASGAESVTIKKNPKKVYNLYASFTTLWYEAGGTAAGIIGGKSSAETYKTYLGRDLSEDEGIEVLATSSSGSKWSPETIVAGQPDLIICSTAMSGYKTIKDPAAAAGIPVIAVSYNSFTDYLKWFKVFCNLSGHPELWETVAEKALDEVLDVLMEIPTSGNPSVFLMFTAAGKQLQANTGSTTVGDMAALMRAKNIVYTPALDESGAERIDINLESVFAAQPDIIMVQCHGTEEEARAQVAEEFGNTAIWKSLNAVNNDKVFYLSKLLFHNKPNSRFAEAYQVMAEILYPDVNFSFKAGK